VRQRQFKQIKGKSRENKKRRPNSKKNESQEGVPRCAGEKGWGRRFTGKEMMGGGGKGSESALKRVSKKKKEIKCDLGLRVS